MRLTILTTTIALALPTTAHAATSSVLHMREHRQIRTLHRDYGTRTFFANHPWLLNHGPLRQRRIARHALQFANARIRWVTRELAETRAALRPPIPHLAAWLCIHSKEGAWNDDGAPYWGGLQFGWNEWRRFGGRYAPSANLATPYQQMLAAEAYWRVSGFRPWPNTARACGLLP